MSQDVSQDAPLRYDLGGHKSATQKRITVNLAGASDIHHDIRNM